MPSFNIETASLIAVVGSACQNDLDCTSRSTGDQDDLICNANNQCQGEYAMSIVCDRVCQCIKLPIDSLITIRFVHRAVLNLDWIDEYQLFDLSTKNK